MPAPSAHRPWRGLLLLWLAALLLNLWGLQHGPLRDWDESLVARVALELSDQPWPQVLLPSQWGHPYLNKPPGAHWLIAGLIQLWRGIGQPPAGALPPEWLLRLGPALGSSLLVPLLGLVQWQLRPGQRAAALWSGAITLTLLPLARHAHLAMLDGLQLSAMALLWLGLLLAAGGGRRTLLAGALAGLATSALLLLKAPVAAPVLLVALALRWADGDLRARQWRWLLAGLALGLMPGLAWHGWHALCRGDAALVMWGRQGLARVTSGIENHSGGPLPPLIQVLSGGWPWLPLWPLAMAAAWQRRREPWGRWCLGLTALVSLMVLPLQTQLPWYSLLLWPPFSLCCAPVMVALVQGELRPVLQRGLPLLWLLLGVGVLLAAALLPPARLALPAAAGLLVAGLGLSPWWPGRRRRALAAWGLVLGWSASLLLLFSSPLWNWELNERPSIRPLLPLVSRESRPGSLAALPLLVEGSIGQRPSLRWYAQDPLGKLRGRRALQRWRRAPALLLVTQAANPAASPLAGRLGANGLEAERCRLERRGEAGWNRWLCPLDQGAGARG